MKVAGLGAIPALAEWAAIEEQQKVSINSLDIDKQVFFQFINKNISNYDFPGSLISFFSSHFSSYYFSVVVISTTTLPHRNCGTAE